MIIHDLVTPFQSHRPQAFPYLPTSSRKALIGIRCDGGFPLILRRQFFFDQVLSIAFVHDGPQVDVMHGFALVHVHHVLAHVAAQTGSVRAVRAFEGPFQAEVVVVFHGAVFALLVNAPHVIIVTGFRPEIGAANVATPTVAWRRGRGRAGKKRVEKRAANGKRRSRKGKFKQLHTCEDETSNTKIWELKKKKKKKGNVKRRRGRRRRGLDEEGEEEEEKEGEEKEEEEK